MRRVLLLTPTLLACALGAVAAAPPDAALEVARALERAGRPDQALEAYAEIATRFADSHPSTSAVALNNSCLIHYRRGQLERASQSCTAALALRHRAGDRRGTARTLNNLGLVLEARGLFDDASSRFEQALAINRERDDREGQAVNLGNLTRLAINRGSYGAALAHLDTAVALVESAAAEPWAPRQLAICRHNEAVVMEKLGLYREALDAYLAVDPDLLDAASRTALQGNLGVVYRNLGDPHLALEAFAAAATGSAANGELRSEVYAELNAGIVLHRDLGRRAEAAESFGRALEASRTLGDAALELRIRLRFADLVLDRGELDAAEAQLVEIAREAESIDFVAGLWQARFGLGRVAVARGRREAAHRLFRQALEVVDGIRANLAMEPAGEQFPLELRPLYAAAVDNLVALALDGGAQALAAEALEVAQSSKRRFAPLGTAPPRHDLAALRSALGDSTLVEYFVGDHDLVRWTVTRTVLVLERLGSFRPVADDVRRVHEALRRGRPADGRAVERLSRALLAGLPDGAVTGPTLYLATDGHLGYLPFEILVPPGAVEPLIATTAVVYLPSGAALVRGERHAAATALRFAGLANPDLGSGSRLSAPKRLVERYGLGALRGAEREVESAVARFPSPSVAYLGAEATEGALRALGGRGASILHLGVHTVIDEATGAQAAILLGPDAVNDGLLLPREIFTLDLPTHLTVLASCRTAIGLDDRSAALSDLAGAFLVAGSESVLATLWAVGDRETETVMGLFYDRLLEGAEPATALRQVKNRLRRDAAWSADHLWSPYVLVGPASEAPFPRRRPATGPTVVAVLTTVLVGALVGALVALLSRRRTR